jgi:hypothetical protein
MIEKKNIDRLFQEKFKDFESVPAEHVWENIEEELREKKRRRIIPIWFRIAGAAAILFIGLLIYNLTSNRIGNYMETVVEGASKDQLKGDGKNADKPATSEPFINSKDDSKIVESSPADQRENSEKQTFENLNSGASNKKPFKSYRKTVKSNHTIQHNNNQQLAENNPANIAKDETERLNTIPEKDIASGGEDMKKNTSKVVDEISSETQDPQLSNAAPQIAVQEKENIIKNQPQEILSDAEIKVDSTAIAVVPNALEELLKEKEKTVTTKEKKINRWQIGTAVAPVYPGSASNGSPIDSRFQGNPKEFKPSLAYGIGVSYAITKKFAIRTGVNNVALEYNTKDIIISQNPNARRLENVNANERGLLVQVDNMPVQPNTALNRTITQFEGDLTQKTGYIEVPIELSYKLLDKKFGIDVIGGVSTLFLNQNEVSIQTSGIEMNIGEANNLNTMHFSGNLGIGFKYDIFKAVEITVEPMLKYQMNTYTDNAGNFKPYFLGVYSGLVYKF